MAHGGLLYLDAWDHKPPFIFLVYYLAGLISQNVEWQAHMLAISAHVATAILIFVIAARLGAKRKVGWFCGIFYAFLVVPPAFQSWSAQADLLMQPFLLMALFLGLSSGRARWFWSGVFWAGAFYFKQSALFYLPLFVYLSRRDALTQLSDFFWGVNALSIIVVAPFALTGRLGLFWQAVMGVNGGYVESGWSALFGRAEIREQFFDLLSNGLAVYGLATFAVTGLYIARLRKKGSKGEVSEINLAPLIFFGCSLIACCISGSFYSYYFVAVLPGLALMVPTSLRWFSGRPQWQIAVYLAFLFVPEMGAIFRYISNPELELDKAGYSLSRMQAAKDVGEYLRQNAPASDSLVLWDSEPQIYAYSGLQFHGVRTPLVIHLYLIHGAEEEFESALQADPPDWFVVGYGISTPPLPVGVRELLNNRFHLITELGTKDIYRRIYRSRSIPPRGSDRYQI